MKSFFCCLLLHLTTTAFASPVSNNLNPLQNTNAGSDNGGTSNHPAPFTLTYPTVPSTSAAPTPFTFTSIAKSQQEDSCKECKGRPRQQSGSRADESDQERQARRTETNRMQNVYRRRRLAAETDQKREARWLKRRNNYHSKKARELAERNAAAESDQVGEGSGLNFNTVLLDFTQPPVGETPVLRNFDTLQLDLNPLPVVENPVLQTTEDRHLETEPAPTQLKDIEGGLPLLVNRQLQVMDHGIWTHDTCYTPPVELDDASNSLLDDMEMDEEDEEVAKTLLSLSYM